MTDRSQKTRNRRIEEIRPGDLFRLERKLGLRDLELVAALAGGAAGAGPAGPAIWAGALAAGLVAGQLSGKCRIDAAELGFDTPLTPDETLALELRVESVDAATGALVLDCAGTRTGTGTRTGPGAAPALAGRLRLTMTEDATAAPDLPELIVEERGAKFRALIARAEALDPIPTAVVHPVEPNALSGAIEAAQAGLITPIFVGPEAALRAAAESAGLDLSPWQIVAAAHPAEAATTAAALARDGKAHALMKGSLHTDVFLHPILLPEMNLRTERRLSHVFLMDVPAYDRPLFITDGAINIAPDLAAKKEIVENAVLMAQALGIATPRVAILSAVEVVNPRIPSTLDAAALCKMAERGQISGAILDGPLAFDNAVSKMAAGIKHIQSPVAGQADILLAPDLDAGNMIAKQLEYLAGSEAAGVVLGARVPIVLTSRADSAQSRLASCAVAALIRAGRAGGAA